MRDHRVLRGEATRCATGHEYCGSACVDVLGEHRELRRVRYHLHEARRSCVGGTCTNCGATNDALTATASTSSGGVTTYGPQNANDNILETAKCSPYSWISTSGGSTTEWIQYTWTTSHTLTKVHMDTAATSSDICGWNDQTATGAEVQCSGTARRGLHRRHSCRARPTHLGLHVFTSAVSTSKIRLYSLRSPSGYNAFIFELQAFRM